MALFFFLQLSFQRQAKLFCQYRHNNHPYLILRPVKEEQLFDKPTILLLHDVMSNTDIEKIKALAVPQVNNVSIHVESSKFNGTNSIIVENNSSTIVAACFGIRHHQQWNDARVQSQ
jgi:hypothetical protein